MAASTPLLHAIMRTGSLRRATQPVISFAPAGETEMARGRDRKPVEAMGLARKGNGRRASGDALRGIGGAESHRILNVLPAREPYPALSDRLATGHEEMFEAAADNRPGTAFLIAGLRISEHPSRTGAISGGTMSPIRAMEKFDGSRGNKFNRAGGFINEMRAERLPTSRSSTSRKRRPTPKGRRAGACPVEKPPVGSARNHREAGPPD